MKTNIDDLKTVNLTCGFENLDKQSVKINIRVSLSNDFRIRCWLMTQLTKAYGYLMNVLSKGVIVVGD